MQLAQALASKIQQIGEGLAALVGDLAVRHMQHPEARAFGASPCSASEAALSSGTPRLLRTPQHRPARSPRRRLWRLRRRQWVLSESLGDCHRAFVAYRIEIEVQDLQRGVPECSREGAGSLRTDLVVAKVQLIELRVTAKDAGDAGGSFVFEAVALQQELLQSAVLRHFAHKTHSTPVSNVVVAEVEPPQGPMPSPQDFRDHGSAVGADLAAAKV
mmetsp:Transcript_13797/g.37406  ORF Transcript_13797/g.37406 Transcript_13797/m.37406 type:complete len:216 (-) Transcript_13797:283-930(-)